MNLIERVLCKLFQHVDISDDDGAQVYLRRWFVYPRNPKDNKLQGRLYLHKFCKSDNLRDLHDHPWPYQTFILWAGYFEHSFNPAWLKHDKWYRDDPRCQIFTPKTRKRWYGPFSSFRRGAKWTHAVELKDEKPAWTLFFTGPKERSWGFHTDKGWCWHRNYRGGVCWCYDPPPALDATKKESPADEIANVHKEKGSNG